MSQLPALSTYCGGSFRIHSQCVTPHTVASAEQQPNSLVRLRVQSGFFIHTVRHRLFVLNTQQRRRETALLEKRRNTTSNFQQLSPSNRFCARRSLRRENMRVDALSDTYTSKTLQAVETGKLLRTFPATARACGASSNSRASARKLPS